MAKLRPKVEDKRRKLKTDVQAKATAPSSGVGGGGEGHCVAKRNVTRQSTAFGLPV